MGNIPDRDPITGQLVINAKPFAATDGYETDFMGTSGTATAGQTTNIDFKIETIHYMNGVHLLLKDQACLDTVNFQIVDKDGILTPAGTVLKQFGTNWPVDCSRQNQDAVVLNFLAKVLAGLYIRVVYISTGQTNVTVKVRLHLFKKVA